MRSDKNGAACKTITSLLFGDGMTVSGSCGDPSTRHFTGKEHDAETGLDDFGARYYSSQLGRFVSADWSDVPVPVPYANLTNPQTLNLYALVQDNPATFADLDGHLAPGQLGSFEGFAVTPRDRQEDGSAACLPFCDSAITTWELTLNAAGAGIFFSSEAAGTAFIAQNFPQKQPQQYDSSKTGPEDPTKPGRPLYQNPIVKKASDEAFIKTQNGEAGDGPAEGGFAIEYKDGKISIDHKVDTVHGDGVLNHLHAVIDEDSIAFFHVHGNKALPTPSPGDRDHDTQVPNFVRSRSALYVTVPHPASASSPLNQYIQIQ